MPVESAGPVYEFSAAGTVSSNQAVPDAPLPARTSKPHGQVNGFLGSIPILAPDATLRDVLPVSELGGSLGGSIGWGRSSYFVSLDQFGMSQRKMLSFLTSMRAQTGNDSLPVNLNPAASGTFVARADHQFSQRDSAYAQFNRDNLRSYSLRPDAKLNVPGLATDIGISQQTAAVGNTVTISPNTLDETKAQFISSDVQLPAGAPAIGIQSNLPTARRDKVFEAASNIYRQIGGQGLRMGGDFISNEMNISFIESGLGRVSSGNASFSQSDRSTGLYAQSEKQVNPSLVLTCGIRYDVQTLRGFRTDTNNLAPQLGVAWAPSSSTVIRGGVGIYYDQIPLPAVAGPLDADTTANILNSGRFVSRDGLLMKQVALFTTMSPTIQNSYAEHGDIEVEQKVGATSVISAESQNVRGVQLALPESKFVSLCTSSLACKAGNTFWGQEIGSGAVSTYSGTSVAFTQQPTHWGSYKVAYAYATAQGAGTGENSSLVSDTMRRATFTGVLHTSAEPGSDLWQHLANGFVLTGTADYLNRSEFTGLDFFTINARIMKTIAWGQRYHLDALAETCNMMQRANAAFARSLAETGGSAVGIYSAYEKVASMQSPDGGRVGIRLNF
ncbi:MAG TPA: TonB-dependent receptor [Terracidiphilus sp.]|nr:TonB-dependent receptor [Terracidiphilus sp.]